METTLLDALDAELHRRRAGDLAHYSQIVARSHDPGPDDPSVLADLMTRLGTPRETIASDVESHLRAHERARARERYDLLIGRGHAPEPDDTAELGELVAVLGLDHETVDADLQRHEHEHSRQTRILELTPRVVALAREVRRLEAAAEFSDGRLDEPLRRLASGALALGFPYLTIGIELASVMAALPADFLRSCGWLLTQGGPRRPDAVQTLTVGEAIKRQVDDDAGPVRAALTGWLESHASDGNALDLPPDPDAQLAALERAAADLEARRDSLAGLDDSTRGLVWLACAALALRAPTDVAPLCLRALGWHPARQGFWTAPDGTLIVAGDALRVAFKRLAKPAIVEDLFAPMRTAAWAAIQSPVPPAASVEVFDEEPAAA